MTNNTTALFPTSLREVILILWRSRLLFLFVFLAVVAGVAVLAWSMQPRYRVTTQLFPASSEDQSVGMASLLGQVGGLASLAGISISGSSGEQEAIAWLRSRRLAERFIEDRNLMPVLFPDLWDQGRQQWKTNLRPEEVPTADDAWRFFDQNVRRISQDQKTGIVTLEIRWGDPKVAAEWANDLVVRANDSLRERAVQNAESVMTQLQMSLEGITDVEMRQSLYRLIAVEMRRRLLAESRLEYAFSVLDAAVPPDSDRYDSPKKFLMLFLSIPLGLFLATISTIFLTLARTVYSWLRA